MKLLLLLLLLMPGARSGPRRVKRLKQILDRRLKQQRAEQIRRRQIQLTRELQSLGVKPRFADQRWKRELSRALARLHSPDAGERAAAAWWIGVNEVKGAWRPMVKLMRDPNPTVRANAVFALGRLSVKHMAPAIYDRLDRDRSVEVQGRAAVALGRLHYHRALPLILKMLSSSDPRLKLSAVEALGWMGDPAGLERLAALAKAKDDQVRIETARALGRLGLRRAVPVLVRLLGDRSPLVASEAVRALARLRARKVVAAHLSSLLHRPARQVRLAAIHAVVALDAVQAASSLKELLADDSPLLVAEAAHACAKLGQSIPDQVLVRLLDEDDNRIRVLAVRTAMLVGARWAVERIRGFLASPHEPLVIASARALAWLEDEGSKTKILGLLQSKSEDVRRAALDALALLGGSRALAACVVMLSDRAVAPSAARCVGRLAGVDRALALRGVKGLLKLMRLKAPCDQASQAAFALGALRAPDRLAFIRVIRLTLNQDPRCRRAAALALGSIKGGSRSEASSVLARMLDKDRDASVRAAAALGLALLGRRGSLAVMAGLAKRPDLSFEDRFTVVAAMAVLEPGWRRRVGRLFVDRACGPPVTADRAFLVDLLAGLDRPWVKDILVEAEKCPSALVRMRARKALGHEPPAARRLAPRAPAKPSRPLPRKPAAANRAPKRKVDSGIAGPFPRPSHDRGCGCSSSSHGPAGVVVWFVLGLFGLLVRRGQRAPRGDGHG